MDLLLLVLPSLLFALLQYKSSAHSQEVKLIQEGLEEFLRAREVDEKKLRDGSPLKKNLDAIRVLKPKSIREGLFRAFVAYLLLIAAVHCAGALGWEANRMILWNPDDGDLRVTIASVFSAYMVCLAAATCFQIWEISREKKVISDANSAAEEQIELLMSYNLG